LDKNITEIALSQNLWLFYDFHIAIQVTPHCPGLFAPYGQVVRFVHASTAVYNPSDLKSLGISYVSSDAILPWP
jgi:hypothetical protein